MADDQQTDQQHILEADSIGMGLTVDQDGEAVVLLYVIYQGQPIGVALTSEMARHAAATITGFSVGADEIQAKLAEMTPEEVETEIRRLTEQLLNDSVEASE